MRAAQGKKVAARPLRVLGRRPGTGSASRRLIRQQQAAERRGPLSRQRGALVQVASPATTTTPAVTTCSPRQREQSMVRIGRSAHQTGISDRGGNDVGQRPPRSGTSERQRFHFAADRTRRSCRTATSPSRNRRGWHPAELRLLRRTRRIGSSRSADAPRRRPDDRRNSSGRRDIVGYPAHYRQSLD
jgi:hypothetical protein